MLVWHWLCDATRVCAVRRRERNEEKNFAPPQSSRFQKKAAPQKVSRQRVESRSHSSGSGFFGVLCLRCVRTRTRKGERRGKSSSRDREKIEKKVFPVPGARRKLRCVFLCVCSEFVRGRAATACRRQFLFLVFFSLQFLSVIVGRVCQHMCVALNHHHQPSSMQSSPNSKSTTQHHRQSQLRWAT